MSKPKHGMTAFLLAIIAQDMTTERLRKMDTAKTAKHYRIPEQWVSDERKWQLGQRGVRT